VSDTLFRERGKPQAKSQALAKSTAVERGAKMNTYQEGKAQILATFSVKGYKSWTAREGVGAQATLYKDGKRIGWVTDEGNGGEVDFDANTVEDRTIVFEFVKTLPEYKFNDMWKEQYGEEWDGDEDSELRSWYVYDFADLMLQQAEEEKQLKKQRKLINKA